MKRFVGVFVIGVVASGCARHETSIESACHDFTTAPGSIVQRPGIEITVRNAQGTPLATRVSAALDGPPRSVVGNPRDSLAFDVYVNQGTYTVHLSSPFYIDAALTSVEVRPGDCGLVATTAASVTLQTVAGAPPVRSVSLFGSDFLATPGNQARLVPIVDADLGVSRALTWRSSDTTLARVDQTGLVTSRCSVRGGADTVTATSVVDPTVAGRAVLGVGANASCPSP